MGKQLWLKRYLCVVSILVSASIMQDTRLVTACYCRRIIAEGPVCVYSCVYSCVDIGGTRVLQSCLPADGRSTLPMHICRLANFCFSRQFAIRTTIRQHHVMSRDDVIRQVATVVGDQHSVDLKHYDWLILVEIYRVRRFPSSGYMQ